MNQHIEVSREFKKTASKAIISIVIFLVFYITVFSFALYGFWLALKFGTTVILKYPGLKSLALGIVVIGFAGLILFFLIKFIFKSNKYDTSSYYEIHKEDEPELFAFINEIVQDVNVDFPKRTYLSTEVNACVFYDSNFLSMFLPVRKNLMIGMGLINTCTELELKGIIAHEFGHFSQRSMKMGSYVSNVNHIIFNMLYDNASYNRFINRASNFHTSITLLVYVIQLIIGTIKWVMRILYKVINKNYLALSKQMEYHADEVAATLVGHQPIEKVLYRMDLASQAYTRVLNIYSSHIKITSRSQNVFPEQLYVLTTLGKLNSNEFKGGLPIVKEGDIERYSRSKIEFNDHWDSHPSTPARIAKLKSLFLLASEDDLTPANRLLKNSTATEILLTNKEFDTINSTTSLPSITFEEFKANYDEFLKENYQNKYYQNYYNEIDIKVFDLEEMSSQIVTINENELYTNTDIENALELAGLYNDRNTLYNLIENPGNTKYLHYDRQKYTKKQFRALYEQIQNKITQLYDIIKIHDIKVYQFFLNREATNGTSPLLRQYYQDFFNAHTTYDERMLSHADTDYVIQQLLGGMNLEDAHNLLRKFPTILKKFQSEMEKMLALDNVQIDINQDMLKSFDQLKTTTVFLFGNKLNDEAIDIVLKNLDSFRLLNGSNYFYIKKRILDYQVSLL